LKYKSNAYFGSSNRDLREGFFALIEDACIHQTLHSANVGDENGS
jgi:hypothetical protein